MTLHYHRIHGLCIKSSSNLRVRLKFYTKPLNTSIVQIQRILFRDLGVPGQLTKGAQKVSDHHIHIIMVLKAFEESVSLLLTFYDTACIVTVEFACS